jgi:hypothetical protein
MDLFDIKNRKYIGPPSHNENSYDYYDRSSRKDVSNMRNILNKWFHDYPESEREELKKRIKKTFSSTFYELFIFELFKYQGFEITIHPTVPNSKKKPDFLMKKGDFEFYLEAKESNAKSKEQQAMKNRINQVYDSINTIKSPNFFLNIEELILKTSKQPSVKGAINRIQKEISDYDPDEITDQIKKFGIEISPRINIEDNELKLAISLIPKDPPYRYNDFTPIGIYPFESFWGGAEESIKNAFTKKANRYGKLYKPYIICINSIGSRFTGDYDVGNAIWGSFAFSWSNDPANRDEKLIRLKNGLFLNSKGPTFQNVNGILITYVMEFNIPVSRYWFVKHPYPNYNISFDIFDLAYQYVKDRNIITNPGKSFGEILRINTNWLNL